MTIVRIKPINAYLQLNTRTKDFPSFFADNEYLSGTLYCSLGPKDGHTFCTGLLLSLIAHLFELQLNER